MAAGGAVHDLAQLEALDEATLVAALHSRYSNREIYTYVGDILIAVNPYADLGIYGADHVRRYTKAPPGSLPPHVFAVADSTFSALVRTSRSQVCVVSGESGAGKTESTKLLIRHILSRCSGSHQNLHDQIEQMSPVLEAFGNAQTVMNNNSSRFGKFLEITFDSHGGVMGGLVTEYLLERSRVVMHGEGERSFHAFYYFVAGLTDDERGRMGVAPGATFRTLGDQRRDTDKGRWRELVSALATVGIAGNDLDNMLALIAAVLNCGELRFDSTDDEGSALRNAELGQHVARLLRVAEGELVAALTTKVTTFMGERIAKALTARQATDCSLAVAKAVYGRLFSWIVQQINAVLATGAAGGHATSVGLLDIFGFENFEVNSFEQVCINLANEKLQFYFNEHIFKHELDEYRAEGLGGISLKYADNTPVLDLLTKRPLSVLTILDEESRLQSSSDSSFAQKMSQHLVPKAGPIFKCGAQDFNVTHYAGVVQYRTRGFVDKNRDALPELVSAALAASANPLLAALFKADGEAAGGAAALPLGARPSRRRASRRSMRKASVRPPRGRKKAPTVGSQFVASLDLLIAKMTQADPHFVRCLKPNRDAAPNSWNEELVIEQLKYTGMLETIRIRREGFAVRLKFGDFMQRYSGIAFDFSKSPVAGSAANVTKVLELTKIQGYLVGKTKVFLKYYHADALLQRLEQFAAAALKVQTWLRKVRCMQNLKRLLAVARAESESSKVFLLDMTAASGRVFHLLGVTHAEDERRRTAKLNAAAAPAEVVEPGAAAAAAAAPVFHAGPVKVPEPGTKAHVKHTTKLERESLKWFRNTQRDKVTDRGEPQSGKKKKKNRQSVSPWFHGLISRERAEKALYGCDSGTFLIRVAQERLGYSISLHWEREFKHIPIFEDENDQYCLVETATAKKFKTLPMLVAYYRDHDITPEHNERLITPLCEVAVRSHNPSRAPSMSEEDEVDYVELVWDEKLAKRRIKTGADPLVSGPGQPNAVSAFVAGELVQDKRHAINNPTVLSIEKRFGKQQTAADHIYLPTRTRKQQSPPKVILRTHTQVVRQKQMIADAEKRILAARAEWRRRRKADELNQKMDKKAQKKTKAKRNSGQAVAGPTLVDLEGGGGVVKGGKSHDYRSLKGIIREMHMLPP